MLELLPDYVYRCYKAKVVHVVQSPSAIGPGLAKKRAAKIVRTEYMSSVFVNSRVLKIPSNGQRRVAQELIQRMPDLVQVAPPDSYSSGMKGHAWEQLVLPMRTRQGALWSPSTTGPIVHRNHIATIHDIAWVDVSQFFGKRFAWWYGAMIERLVHSARHVVASSDFTRRRLIEHYGMREDLVSTIYLGASDAFSPHPAEDVRSIRERFSLGDEPYFVAFLGTDPRKNTPQLLQAWDRSGLWKQGLKLVLFGRKGNTSVFAADKTPIEARGTVLVGSVDDVTLATLYSGAHGLLFPSMYEGFGLPVVEAARCGSPILTTRCASLPEVSPRDAYFVDPDDLDQIAETIALMACKSYDPAASERRIRDMEKFTWDRTARQYEQLFREKFV
jgi:glycosyltransferase involved in cell wall biosynthesis